MKNSATLERAARDGLEPRYLIGRAASGAQLGGGTLYHATDSGAYGIGKALCGKQPGRRSAGWSCYPGKSVTCPRCLKKLELLNA